MLYMAGRSLSSTKMLKVNNHQVSFIKKVLLGKSSSEWIHFWKHFTAAKTEHKKTRQLPKMLGFMVLLAKKQLYKYKHNTGY